MRPRLKKLSITLTALSLAAGGVVAGILTAPDALALNNGLSITPAMGWSSWSFVRRSPTLAKMKAQAQAMHDSGLQAHGYLYVNLDDFFMKCDGNGPTVDGNGLWQLDQSKFPTGGDTLKPLADFIHGLGLKFGLYVTPGIPANAVLKNTPIAGTSFHAKDIADTSKTEKNYNCKHMYYINYSKPGAQEYVNSFAKKYSSWGVDYLKIDGVGAQDIPDVQAWSKAVSTVTPKMNFALSNNLPIANGSTWANLANSWRTQGDVECYCSGQPNGVGYPLTNWAHISGRFTSTASWQQFAGPGHWNDYDSIEIGSGDQAVQTISGVNKQDIRRTQLTLWSMAAAPLLLGTDLTLLTNPNPPADIAADKAMLFNDRVIAVDQDGVAAKRIVNNSNGGMVYSKKQKDGTYVVALFNSTTSGSLSVSVNWSQVGFTGSAQVTDLWSGKSGGTVANSYSATLRPTESRLILVKPGTSSGGGSTVEAEAGSIAGAARIGTCSACSGGQKVGFIGNGAANFVTLDVTPSAAGSRTLTISYLLSGTRSFFVSVNGGTAVEVPLTGTSFSAVSTKTITVNLNAGSNSIKFFNNTAYTPDLDKISVN